MVDKQSSASDMGGKGKRYRAYDIHINPYNAADFIGEAPWATTGSNVNAVIAILSCFIS